MGVDVTMTKDRAAELLFLEQHGHDIKRAIIFRSVASGALRSDEEIADLMGFVFLAGEVFRSSSPR